MKLVRLKESPFIIKSTLPELLQNSRKHHLSEKTQLRRDFKVSKLLKLPKHLMNIDHE